MKNDLNTGSVHSDEELVNILQGEDETVDDFIRRVLDEDSKLSENVVMNFSDGIKIPLENFDVHSPIVLNLIKGEYQTQKVKMLQQIQANLEEKTGAYKSTVVQKASESEDDFIRRAIDIANKNDEIEFLKFSDGIQIPLKEFDLQSPLALNYISGEHIKQKTLITQGKPNIQENDQKVETVLEEVKDPLKFLLDASSKKYRSEEQQKKLHELEENLSQLEKNREDLIELKKKEREEDYQNVKAWKKTVLEINTQKLVSIKQMINSENRQIQKLKKQLEEARKQAAEGKEDLKKAREEFENPKFSSDETDDVLYIPSSQIELLEWKANNLDEYVSYIADSYMEHIEKLERLTSEQSKIEHSYKEEYKNSEDEFRKKYGIDSLDENGKFESKIENIPEIVEIDKRISQIKNDVAKLQRDPQKIYDEIQMMMRQQRPPEEVEKEIDLLIATISSSEIEGVFKQDQSSYESTEKEIQKIQIQMSELEARIEADQYFKQQEMMDDREEKVELKKEIQNYENVMEHLNSELQRYEEQRKLPELKKTLKQLNKAIEANKKSIKYLVLDEDDLLLQNQTIDNLYKQANRIEIRIHKIQETEKVVNPRQIQRNLEKYEQQSREAKQRIEEIDGKDRMDYKDFEARRKDVETLHKLQEKSLQLEQQQNYLEKHSPEDLKERILEDYKKSVYYISEEEISSITPPTSQALLEKIKSFSFKKKVRAAIIAIVAAVTSLGAFKTADYNSSLAEVKAIESQENVDIENEEEKKEVPESSSEISSQIDIEQGQENITEEHPVLEDSPVEEDVDEAEDVSDLEKDFTDAFSVFVNGPEQAALNKVVDGVDNTVYATAEDALKEQNPMHAITTSANWENAVPGGIYAMVDGQVVAIPYDQVQNYIDQGYEVVSAYENDEGSLGFLHLDNTSESKVR